MLHIPTYPQELEQPDVPAERYPEPEAQVLSSDTSFIDCLPQLFSDHEPACSLFPQLSASDNPQLQTLVGTSAPLITNLL